MALNAPEKRLDAIYPVKPSLLFAAWLTASPTRSYIPYLPAVINRTHYRHDATFLRSFCPRKLQLQTGQHSVGQFCATRMGLQRLKMSLGKLNGDEAVWIPMSIESVRDCYDADAGNSIWALDSPAVEDEIRRRTCVPPLEY